MLLEFVDVVETLAELDSLLVGEIAVHGGLNLGV